MKGIKQSNGKQIVRKTKQDWNTYEKDCSIYKLSKEQLLAKKKLLVSKNNILVESNEQERARIAAKALKREKTDKSISKISPKKPVSKVYLETVEDTSANLTSRTLDESTVLDVLGKQTDIDDYDDDFVDHTFALYGRSILEHTSKTISSINTISHRRPNDLSFSHTKNSRTKASKSTTDDMSDVVHLLHSLTAELKFYEQCTGRTGTFDSEELRSLLEEETSDGTPLSTRGTMLYLVQLVSQTMTHLLRSEMELKASRSQYETLSNRLDDLERQGKGFASAHTKVSSQLSPIPLNTDDSCARGRVHYNLDAFGTVSAKETPSIRQVSKHTYAHKTRQSDVVESDDSDGSELQESFDYSLDQPSVPFGVNGSSTSDWIFSSPSSYRGAPTYDIRNGSF